ncbi:hypothetical protein NDU88_000980 [Pleurodeles waltl]|uniref:Uncharacterized protein n=1 Tax=Pleurodeles waltl TaxID=8319 RepID=A0AAV7UUQ7_PLEWA|nr:hypothetical protein NDU88_000980 [Pleurodeles waltl]
MAAGYRSSVGRRAPIGSGGALEAKHSLTNEIQRGCMMVRTGHQVRSEARWAGEMANCASMRRCTLLSSVEPQTAVAVVRGC